MRNLPKLAIIILIFISSITLPAFGQNSKLMLYDLKINNEVNEDTFNALETEVLEQAEAMMEGTVYVEKETEQIIDPSVLLESFTLDNAVKVVFFEEDQAANMNSLTEIIDNSLDSGEENAMNDSEGKLKYLWRIPIAETHHEYFFSTVEIDSSGKFVCWTATTTDKLLSDVTYLFDKDVIPEILNSSGLNVDYNTVTPVSLNNISTDYIYFRADEKEYAIALSARPDLLGVENGEIYEYSELVNKVDKMLADMSAGSDSVLPSGGGIAVGPFSTPAYIQSLIASTVVCGIFFVYHNKRKH